MFTYLQKIGKSLMIPVSVLPAAAVLMGIGYWIDPIGWGSESILAAFLIKSGASLIDNMGILFAIGVAFGLSKEQDGPAALSGLVAWLVITTLLSPSSVAQLKGIPLEEVPIAFGKIQNQFVGILCGMISAFIYNKYYKTELPTALAFFSGKRLVPIVTACVMLGVSFIFMTIWPIIYGGLVAFGITISGLGAVGAGLFGFLNRLLIPFGLHHALNAVFWFDVAGINDIGNFWSGMGVKGVTGMYQAGFFPIMMFGLIGAICAFITTAKPEQKDKVRSIMLAAGFASFFTGVTEPIEFAFMFLAPGLYFLHAVLTGISLFIASSLQFTAGFGFSAGLVDFILSLRMPLANQPWMLILQGLIFFVIYYLVFRVVIIKYNLKTPGREDEDTVEGQVEIMTSYTDIAQTLLGALGGVENINSVENCAVRIRLELGNSDLIDEKKVKSVSVGLMKGSKTTAQVIIGPKVQFVADELKRLLGK
ncbi:MAG: N-acetylglucosamine-specific PTS transporter subunit IIBC [Brevinema sp.]